MADEPGMYWCWAGSERRSGRGCRRGVCTKEGMRGCWGLKKRWKRIAQAGRVGRLASTGRERTAFQNSHQRQTQAERDGLRGPKTVHMTFTGFEGSAGQASHGLGTEQKRDELVVASMSLSGPASVSRARANGRRGASRFAPRNSLTLWRCSRYGSYCSCWCRAIEGAPYHGLTTAHRVCLCICPRSHCCQQAPEAPETPSVSCSRVVGCEAAIVGDRRDPCPSPSACVSMLPDQPCHKC